MSPQRKKNGAVRSEEQASHFPGIIFIKALTKELTKAINNLKYQY